MSLSTQSLYSPALAQVGGGVGNDKFNQDFINAVNAALDELSDECDEATRHTHISTVNTSITTLAAKDWYILYAGVVFYLMRFGQRPSDPKIAMIVYQDSDKQWEKCKGNYQTRAWNDCQATDSSSMAKFGYLKISTDT